METRKVTGEGDAEFRGENSRSIINGIVSYRTCTGRRRSTRVLLLYIPLGLVNGPVSHLLKMMADGR